MARPLRIGAWLDGAGPGAIYRGIEPLKAMQRRGHNVVRVEVVNERLHTLPLQRCDVVHIYRRHCPQLAQPLARLLTSSGVAVVWDNDDDFANAPDDSPPVIQYGRETIDTHHRWMVDTARLSTVVTTPSATLAQRYCDEGARHAVALPNAVTGGDRPRVPHDGVVIGWIAEREHRSDASRLDIAKALQRLIKKHREVRVECIGVDLGLPTRYEHTPYVPFPELPARMATWDIGIAPLADIPFNHARSDIKLKEYAASGVAWLASDLVTYAHLGPDQGGRLVANDRWFAELKRLVRDQSERQTLADRGVAWAGTQTIDQMADRWEQVYREAAGAVAPTVTGSRRERRARR